MYRKGAVELSINFLVIMIVSIAILSGGLMLFFKLKGSTEDLVRGLDDQIQQQLKKFMLDNNYNVAVWPNIIELSPNKARLIGLGITSTLKNSQVFYMPDNRINLTYYSSPTATPLVVGVTSPGISPGCPAPTSTIKLHTNPAPGACKIQDTAWVIRFKELDTFPAPNNALANITPQDQATFSVLVTAPKKPLKGEYILTMRVKNMSTATANNPSDYGVTKLYITVK